MMGPAMEARPEITIVDDATALADAAARTVVEIAQANGSAAST